MINESLDLKTELTAKEARDYNNFAEALGNLINHFSRDYDIHLQTILNVLNISIAKIVFECVDKRHQQDVIDLMCLSLRKNFEVMRKT